MGLEGLEGFIDKHVQSHVYSTVRYCKVTWVTGWFGVFFGVSVSIFGLEEKGAVDDI